MNQPTDASPANRLQYTWDKQVETWVKKSGILGGAGKDPTVISPKQYSRRFRCEGGAVGGPVAARHAGLLGPPPPAHAQCRACKRFRVR